MSGAKVFAKLFMGIDIGVSFVAAAFTYTTAVNNEAWALIALGIAALSVLIGGLGYERGEDRLGALIVGGIIALGSAGAIFSALNSSMPTLIPWIAFVVGAIVFFCY